MADDTQTQSSMCYWRCRAIPGLSIQVAPPAEGEVAPKTVRFVPYMERYEGEDVKVGYLATDDPRANELLANDGNCEMIEADEYKQFTDPKHKKAKNVRRAPY